MSKTHIKKRNFQLFFTGFSMGFADLIPGVSSGTIALLYGVYQELLYTIKLLTSELPALIFKGKLKQAFKLIPFHFLVPLGLGILTAVFSMVHVVSSLLDTQAVFVWSVFFGLILGSTFVITKRIEAWTIGRAALLLSGLLMTFFIVKLPALEVTGSPIITFAAGAVASMAMILPGISGSLMLVLLGQYKAIISAISDLDVVTLGLFAVGVFTGLALFVRLLSWLLHRHHSAVIATLIGIMLGSLGAIWPWQSADGGLNAPTFDIGFVLSIVLIVFGFIIVIILERIGIAKEHNEDIASKEFVSEIKTQKE